MNLTAEDQALCDILQAGGIYNMRQLASVADMLDMQPTEVLEKAVEKSRQSS